VQQEDVSIVVATRNRSRLALERARWALSHRACKEAVFVVDKADDDTAIVLRELAETDPRLKVLSLDRQVGVPSAKNIGTRSASCEWVLLLDDDDQLSDGFLDALLQVAASSGADIVGVPWLHLRHDESLDAAVQRTPRRPGGPALDRPQIFPLQDWEACCWLPSNSLIRRMIFDSISFDEGYRGNFYREETDFFVSAARSGFRVGATSLAYTYLRERSGGGIERKSKADYEYWVLRNHWRFLRKHGAWLRESGAIDGSIRDQLALSRKRFQPIALAAGRRILRSGR
jgi:glycosyltransferase involved in cell wall biosynthesis